MGKKQLKRAVKQNPADPNSPSVAFPPSSPYVEVEDRVYERLDYDTVQLELDFDESTLALIDAKAKAKGFVSRPEFIRHLLREILQEKEAVLAKTGKKPSKKKPAKKTKKTRK